MMRFRDPTRTRDGENIVAMINVVFLLLIFFLMSAEIVPPDPITLDVPQAMPDDRPAPGQPLFVGPAGELAYGEAVGDAALQALAATDPAATLTLRADKTLKAEELARLLARLAALGISDIQLVTAPQ